MRARTTGQVRPAVIAREHFISAGADGDITLRLRERAPADGVRARATPLLLVHGATFASILWDNPLPQWSWMNRLAEDGFHVFAVDLRGYGKSSRPESFSEPAAANPPYARARDVQADVAAAIGFVKAQTGAATIDLLGGSWGSIVCGMFVSGSGARDIRRLILYAPIYSEPEGGGDWMSLAADPENPSRPRKDLGAYRVVTEAQVRNRWDVEIPASDKTVWRSESMFRALVDGSLAEDPELAGSEPPGFRAPNGTLLDLFDAFSGQPLYDASQIKVPTFLIRGDSDPTSTHADASRLFDGIGSDWKRHCTIGHGAHFVVLERGMMEVHQEVSGFLAATLGSPATVEG